MGKGGNRRQGQGSGWPLLKMKIDWHCLYRLTIYFLVNDASWVGTEKEESSLQHIQIL